MPKWQVTAENSGGNPLSGGLKWYYNSLKHRRKRHKVEHKFDFLSFGRLQGDF